MHFFGDIDTDTDMHNSSFELLRRPVHAVFALHSDESQSLISGRDGVAPSGDMLAEPLTAASMKTIPTVPPETHPATWQAQSQALFSQQLDGRAA
jgi:hypothetical protein